MKTHGNGWKKRPLWRAFADGFQGIGEAWDGRVMRRLLACLAISAAIGVLRPLKELGWIFLAASSGLFIAAEHVNNVIERQEHLRNSVMMKLGLQHDERNNDTRYILHQMTAAVLVLGLTGIIGEILVLVYNPGWQVPAPVQFLHDWIK